MAKAGALQSGQGWVLQGGVLVPFGTPPAIESHKPGISGAGLEDAFYRRQLDALCRERQSEFVSRPSAEVLSATAAGLASMVEGLASMLAKLPLGAPLARSTQARIEAGLKAVGRQIDALGGSLAGLDETQHASTLSKLGTAAETLYSQVRDRRLELEGRGFLERLLDLVEGSATAKAAGRQVWRAQQRTRDEQAGERERIAGRLGSSAAHLRNAARGSPEGDPIHMLAHERTLEACLGTGNAKLAKEEKAVIVKALSDLGRTPSPRLSELFATIDALELKPSVTSPADTLRMQALIERGLSQIPEAFRQKLDRLAEKQRKLESEQRASPGKNAALEALADEIERERNALTQEMSALREGLLNSSPYDQRAAQQLYFTLHTTSSARSAWLGDETSDFLRLTQGKVMATARQISASDRARPGSSPLGGIDLGQHASAYGLWHELGHQLEFSNEELRAAALAFVESRASGPLQPLNELGKNPSGVPYDDHELAYPGRFWVPYLGKVYPDGSTEVLSLGMELFQNPAAMVALYLRDAEHFAFTLGAISP